MKPTSSKGRSPWKVKRGGGTRGGIVIPKDAIVVNQGLRKVKLEEDFVEQKPDIPVVMEIEDVTSSEEASSEVEVVSGEEAITITEEFEVVKVEVDNQVSSEEVAPPNQEASGSCPCGKEIESLKETVKELSLQVDRQNQVIREIKSGLRNAVMSLMACCEDGEEEDEGQGRRQGSSEERQESPGNSSATTAENSVVSGAPIVTPSVQSTGTQEKHCPPSTATVECIAADGNGGQTPSVTFNQPCVSFSIVDRGPSTANNVNINGNVEEDNETNSNLADGDGAGVADQVSDIKETQNDDHNDKLEQPNLAITEAADAESEESQDNLEGEDRLSSSVILEVTGDGSGGEILDKSFEESEKSLETGNDVIQDEDEQDVQSNDGESSYMPAKEERSSSNAILEVTGQTPDESTVSLETEESSENDNMEDEQNVEKNEDRSSSSMPAKEKRRSKLKKSLVCSKCGNKLTTASNLRIHMLYMHSKSPDLLLKKCNLCKKGFKWKSHLNEHVRLVHEGFRYKCDYCPAAFTVKRSVVRHEKKIHTNSKECPPIEECEICGAYLLKTKIGFHMNRVHKKFVSSSTAQETSSRVSSKKNEKTGEKKRTIIFQCRHCPLFFPKREEMYGHVSQVHKIPVVVVRKLNT